MQPHLCVFRRQSFNEALAFYGEAAGQMTVDEFFSIFVNFTYVKGRQERRGGEGNGWTHCFQLLFYRTQLEAAHKQNVERREVAERSERRRLANAARKKIKPGRARVCHDPRRTTDMVWFIFNWSCMQAETPDESDKEQVDINNMLSDLRSGRAFTQKV